MQLPKTTPEQRAPMYEDLQTLLSPGFLAHGTTVNGTRVVQRSLNNNDWTLLQYRVDPNASNSWKRWAVAVSIWMVDGQVILGDEGALQTVYKMCAGLPKNILEDLYSILNALMRKVRNATEIAEGFLYEEVSRSLWKTEGTDLFSTAGLNLGGLNPVQKLWVYFNRAEDTGNQERHDWEMAKFLIGPHVPKGIKKINAKDKEQRTQMRQRRESILDRVYYEAQGVIPKKGEGEKRSRFQKYEGWDVKVAETEEELQDEMRRWVDGTKDTHDDAIDYVKAKIKTERESAKAQAKLKREVLTRVMEEEGVPSTQLVPLTGKAAQDFIDRVSARVPGISKVNQDTTHNSAYEKYIKNNPEVGVLRVDDKGNIISVNDVAADPKELIEMLRKPEDKNPEELQNLVNGRRPTFESLNEDSEGDS